MRPSLAYFREKFLYYNNLCFEGRLPVVPITISDRKGAMGRTLYKIDGNTGNKIICIEISIRFDLPEEEYIDTLVHEMIHYFIIVNDIHDDAPHGKVFTSIMSRIIRDYGIKITIEYSPDTDDMPIGRLRWHYVNILLFNDGTTGFSVVARNKVFSLWKYWESHSEVTRSEWFLSCDPLFDSVAISVSPRAFKTDRARLLRHLATADRLIMDGDCIRPEYR